MLNAPTENGLFAPETHQATLPMMTALFVDGLGSCRGIPEVDTEWLSKSSTDRRARIFRLPIQHDGFLPRQKTISGNDSDRDIQTLRRTDVSLGQTNRVRPLIQGISHYFNNILMGIWGNATLIRLQLKESDPMYTQTSQLEDLIQSGAYLIHLVLGYIGERRTAAKRVRLNQLLAQIKCELMDDIENYAEQDMEQLLIWASEVQNPRMVASSTAHVLDMLFKGIQSHGQMMRTCHTGQASIQEKIDTIFGLVDRGLNLTHQLRLYAVDVKSRKRKIQIASLIKRIVVQGRKKSPFIQVNCHISPNLPPVRVERAHLELVFNQLFTNAAESMPQGGSLEIRACTFQEQIPHHRCGVQKGSDYVVISFKDSGCGMSAKVQKHIFDPFFTFPQKHGRLGLGLAAAAGILRAHNGYIQVQSKEKVGSLFRIYLPIAGAALQGQRLKEIFS